MYIKPIWIELNLNGFLFYDTPISLENLKMYVNDSFWKKKKDYTEGLLDFVQMGAACT